MRKVSLAMNENYKYNIIKKLVETNGNKKTAALKLGYSIRHVNRMIKNYKEFGKEYFSHGNKNRKPIHTTPIEVKQTIINLYLNKYHECNFVHFTELLNEHEHINLSSSTVSSILSDEYIVSPKAHRSTKKHVKQVLKAKQSEKKLSIKERDKCIERIIAIEDAQPRRSRSAYFGEMIQLDASDHHWFGAHFDKQETLNGYYNIFNQILIDYGIPYMFFTDRRTVFEYKQKKAPQTEEDTFTQFGYACHQLGVEIKTSSVPQAKGRVERLFQTFQSRLPIELRLSGVTTIEQANEFLNSYIKKFNAQFTLSINHSKSVFEKQPNTEKINLTLAVLADRKIDAGHCVKFDKKYYKPVDCRNIPVYYHKGTKALIIKAFNGELFVTIHEKIYALEEIPKRESKSKYFDTISTKIKPKEKYIPPMNHPWRLTAFKKYVDKQPHRTEKSA